MQVENGSVEALGSRIVENVGRVLVGKAAEIELCVIALLSRGHILIEDVPGVGKTMLAKSLARSLSCGFERLQFTPDLLPSDVTGVNIYSPSTQQFEFRQGPIFTQILLADEINRATPKTQSALLEAMEERQVTIDGETHELPRPFLVMATQNPVEYAGTYPLPEAQLDRFMMKVRLGYLTASEESEPPGVSMVKGFAVGALAMLLFFAWLTAIRPAFTLFYVLAALLLLSWVWPRLAARRISLQRSVEFSNAVVGDEFRETIEVR